LVEQWQLEEEAFCSETGCVEADADTAKLARRYHIEGWHDHLRKQRRNGDRIRCPKCGTMYELRSGRFVELESNRMARHIPVTE